MRIREITFRGLIQNRQFREISGPEFQRALHDCGWKEGTNTHFFRELRKDGPTRGVHTPADLARVIARGTPEPAGQGKTCLWVCGGRAKIIYNDLTRTLITFTQGEPRADTR